MAADARILVDRLIRVFNEGMIDNLDQVFTRDFVRHGPQNEEPVRGAEAYKRMVESYRKLIPDLRSEMQDFFQHGDKAVSRFRATGTLNGKSIVLEGVNIYRISEGKIAENWTFYDTAVLLQATGAPKKIAA
jgi:steroid delta-isomerase-like uncharacterized protein